ncbi:MAG TPA: EamA family transporter [Candidatus Sulfotelmatobacter sp.]|nr:EamA family transporter [Candidatus Sulfotelmatobacter sp.]
MQSTSSPPLWKLLLAYSIIYFVWGSTYLAIRVGVREVPPFLLAGIRFLIAGVALYAWIMVREERSPKLREWGSSVLISILIFVCDYGLLFWAEQRVPSGLAAVMLATIPAFLALFEILILRTRRLTVRLVSSLLVGLGGVGVLVSRGIGFGEAAIDKGGAIALGVAAVGWSLASILTRILPLPSSKVTSSAAQMLSGGILLMLTSAALGEFRGFHIQSVSRSAWFALVYLIVAGSIVAYTAYIWLLHHESPTKVGTYAYVNPVVAVLLGYFFGGEAMGARTIVGTVCVLVSVVMLTTGPSTSSQPVREKGAQPA